MLKIKRSTSLNSPFILRPAPRNSLWGGVRLKNDYGKDFNISPIAETWECSTHPHGLSTVVTGRFKGRTLKSVLWWNPRFRGTNLKHLKRGQIPILIKFIDARDNLSVQVHPSDDYARKYENGSLGKTEMWYVAHASKDASLVYGFNQDVTPEIVEDALKKGNLDQYLNKVNVEDNQVYFVEAGTIHGIGAGSLIVEVQESSDLTYRLYDYNRVDKNGNKRELHVDKALAVMNMHKMNPPRQPIRILRYVPGMAFETLVRCKYFEVERLLINTSNTKKLPKLKTSPTSFEVLVCYSGCGSISYGKYHSSVNFFKGDTIFIPANSTEMRIHGNAELLKIHC